jgi:hypothetical protein
LAVADRAYAGPTFLVQACSPKKLAMKRNDDDGADDVNRGIAISA